MRLLLVDRILELERGQRATGIKNVTMSEDIFVDHFPEHPIMPGALLTESIVQLADWVIRECADFEQQGRAVGFDKIKFHRFVQPGDQLRVEVEITSRTETEALVKGKIRCEDELITSTTFTMEIEPIESAELQKEYARQFRILLGEGRRRNAPGRALW